MRNSPSNNLRIWIKFALIEVAIISYQTKKSASHLDMISLIRTPVNAKRRSPTLGFALVPMWGENVGHVFMGPDPHFPSPGKY
jgi:hypothetical protein